MDGKYYSITGTEKYTRVKITRPVFLCRTGIYNIKNGSNNNLDERVIDYIKQKKLYGRW